MKHGIISNKGWLPNDRYDSTIAACDRWKKTFSNRCDHTETTLQRSLWNRYDRWSVVSIWSQRLLNVFSSGISSYRSDHKMETSQRDEHAKSFRFLTWTKWVASPGGGYSLIWPIRGCAAGQGMVFGLSVLNRVGDFVQICPKQGI